MSGERALIIAVSPGEIWAALCHDEELIDLRLVRSTAQSAIGALYLGRIVALQPELPAALVDIGLPRPAFLSAEDADRRTGIAAFTEGQSLIVQVTKEARGDKAVGVTARPRLEGRLLTMTPGRAGLSAARGLLSAERERLTASFAPSLQADDGFILRREAAGADAAALRADADALNARWQSILAASRNARAPSRLEEPEPLIAEILAEFAPLAPDRIVIDDRAGFAAARGWVIGHHPALVSKLALHAAAEPIFEHFGIAAAMQEALASRVALPGGGALIIDSVAAATLIDVDSGGAPLMAANLAAAHTVARQLRLRNLAGPIIIDFIAMRREDRARVRDMLAAALAAEAPDVEILGWTRLGHLELVRKRRRASLAEQLLERSEDGGCIKTALTVALEALRAAAREAAAVPGRAPVLQVSPEVAALLGDGAAQAARRALEAQIGRPLIIQVQPGRARDAFDIAGA